MIGTECPIGSFSAGGASISTCTGPAGVCDSASVVSACPAGYYCPSVGMTNGTVYCTKQLHNFSNCHSVCGWHLFHRRRFFVFLFKFALCTAAVIVISRRLPGRLLLPVVRDDIRAIRHHQPCALASCVRFGTIRQNALLAPFHPAVPRARRALPVRRAHIRASAGRAAPVT